MRKFISIIKGCLSYLPFATVLFRQRGTGGSNSAKYCYGVWLKHLTILWDNGVTQMPKIMAELGPGDSLGVGLAAILCGVEQYFALDIVAYTNIDKNLKILDELLFLFKNRTGIDKTGWPDFSKSLDRYNFPSHILTNDILAVTLAERRVERIKLALENPRAGYDRISINYIVPWYKESSIKPGFADLILSHSVLEYIDDLHQLYSILNYWLKPAGIMSHQIDLKSHRLTNKWNGHWSINLPVWQLIKGKRPSVISRNTYSAHLSEIKNCGFEIICNMKAKRSDGIKRSDLAKEWKHISNDDIAISGMFIQARKK